MITATTNDYDAADNDNKTITASPTTTIK